MRLSVEKIEAIKQKAKHCFGAQVDARLFGSRMNHQRAFTMVELITVMVIMGILAAVAAPRFFDSNTFQARGFADQVQATLRYAQKEAIAKHRFVCADFTANSVTLTYDPISPSASHTVAACTDALASPGGDAAYSVSSSSASFLATPTAFYFDALGKPSVNQSITINDVANSIVVEAETGYVHAN